MSGSPSRLFALRLTALSGRFFRFSRPGRHPRGLLLSDRGSGTGTVIEEVRLLAGEPLDVPQRHDGLAGEVGAVAHLLGAIAVLCAGKTDQAPTYRIAVTAVGRVAEHPFYGVAPNHREEVLGAFGLAEARNLAPLQGTDDGVLVRIGEFEELLAVPILGVSVERAHALPVGSLPPEVGARQGPVHIVHDPGLPGARIFVVAGEDPGSQSLDRVRLVQEKEHEPCRIDLPLRIHQRSSFPLSLLRDPACPPVLPTNRTVHECASTIKNHRTRSRRRRWCAAWCPRTRPRGGGAGDTSSQAGVPGRRTCPPRAAVPDRRCASRRATPATWRGRRASSLQVTASTPSAAPPVGSSWDPLCGGSTSSSAQPQLDGGTSCNTTWTFSRWASPTRPRMSVIPATNSSFCSGVRPANHSTCTTTIEAVLLLRDDGPIATEETNYPSHQVESSSLRCRRPVRCRQGEDCSRPLVTHSGD